MCVRDPGRGFKEVGTLAGMRDPAQQTGEETHQETSTESQEG